MKFDHQYSYDPSYGYSFNDLCAVGFPSEPYEFPGFWRKRYQLALIQNIKYELGNDSYRQGYRVIDIQYQSTGGCIIGGWLLEPINQTIRRGLVVGHGYGGRTQPDFNLTFAETALLFPCFRGISRSRCSAIPEEPHRHVLHGIESRDDYVIGGCVDDLWVAVSTLLKIYPDLEGTIGYLGISFGGGIGALAAPWDDRIKAIHLNVPTFGNHPLRLGLQTTGSANALQAYAQQTGHFPDTLAYYDAAIAACHAQQPLHAALALFDPVVAPPGQFSIYNAWNADKKMFVLDAGHFEYPGQREQDLRLITELKRFFSEI